MPALPRDGNNLTQTHQFAQSGYGMLFALVNKKNGTTQGRTVLRRIKSLLDGFVQFSRSSVGTDQFAAVVWFAPELLSVNASKRITSTVSAQTVMKCFGMTSRAKYSSIVAVTWEGAITSILTRGAGTLLES